MVHLNFVNDSAVHICSLPLPIIAPSTIDNWRILSQLKVAIAPFPREVLWCYIVPSHYVLYPSPPWFQYSCWHNRPYHLKCDASGLKFSKEASVSSGYLSYVLIIDLPVRVDVLVGRVHTSFWPLLKRCLPKKCAIANQAVPAFGQIIRAFPWCILPYWRPRSCQFWVDLLVGRVHTSFWPLLEWCLLKKCAIANQAVPAFGKTIWAFSWCILPYWRSRWCHLWCYPEPFWIRRDQTAASVSLHVAYHVPYYCHALSAPFFCFLRVPESWVLVRFWPIFKALVWPTQNGGHIEII